MTGSNASRRQFLGASGAVALQSIITGRPAAAQASSARLFKRFSFAQGSAGMLPFFTDYSILMDGFDFLAEVRDLPEEVQVYGRNRRAYFIRGNNHSDDLFMCLKAVVNQADGITPGQSYLLSFDIVFASNNNNCVGVGGGEDSVYLKAGGSTREPLPILESNGTQIVLSIDKGNQATGGKDLGVIGSIWNGKECPIREWVMLRRMYSHPFPVQATMELGQLWIAVGLDSGYESVTGVYFYSIGVGLTPVAG